MANTLQGSKIFYAIEINTGTTETVANSYLNDGKFRFTTDNYDPVTASATYEDLTPVTGTWSKDSLKADGIDNTSIDMDITQSTGYATLAGLSFSIINACIDGSPWHRAVTQFTDSYLIGSKVTFYVIIDGVLYSRWVGIVSDYAISDRYIKINCEDNFVKGFDLFPKTTIGAVNYPNAKSTSVGKVIPVSFGDIKYASLLNVEDEKSEFKLGSSFPLVRVKPNISTGIYSLWESFEDDEIDYNSNDPSHFLGTSPLVEDHNYVATSPTPHTLYCIINYNKAAICISTPIGEDLTKYVGKFVTFSNNSILTDEDKANESYLEIVEADFAKTDVLTPEGFQLAYLLVDGIPEVTDFTNFYGDVTTEPIVGINEMTDDSIYVYIWTLTNKYKVSENDVTFVNTYTANPKALSEVGDITCYRKTSNDKIMAFNPTTINQIDDHTLSIMKGTSEVYHIPDSSRYHEYADATDPVQWQSLGSSDCSRVLDPTITWDDDNFFYQYSRNYSSSDEGNIPVMTSTTKTYNTNSMYFYNDVDGVLNGKDILSYIMNYNINSFDPYVYTRVLPTPIWNPHAYSLLARYPGEFYPQRWAYGYGRKDCKQQNVEVYGLTNSSFNGMIKTATMGYVRNNVCRVRAFGHSFNTDRNPDEEWGYMSIIGLPVNITTTVEMPDPVSVYSMTGLEKFNSTSVNPGEINNGIKSTSYFGDVRTSKSGLIGFYKCVADNNESLVLDRSSKIDTSDISENLWKSFDENGNIQIVMDMFYTNGADLVPVQGGKTVHLIGLTGYIDYTPDELYVRVNGELCGDLSLTNSVAGALKHLVTDYNTITNVDYTNINTYRSDWNVGRQVKEQHNSLDYIDELCKQSWVVGWTNREGTMSFKAFESDDTPLIHDNNLILEDSISNFALTPITKVCNEITIQCDWNEIAQKYDKVYSVDKIDEDTFPAPDDTDTNEVQCTTGLELEYLELMKGSSYFTLDVPDANITTPIVIGDLIKFYFYDSTQYLSNGSTSNVVYTPYSFITAEVIAVTLDSGVTQFRLDANTADYFDVINYDPLWHTIRFNSTTDQVWKVVTTETKTGWQNYVQGINSYGDAKDIWTICKNAWYQNKTINKYPDSLSKLSWFNNRNSFNDSNIYDETEESGYKFFTQAIEWVTTQKYKINYKLPLTPDTVKIEFFDKVNFFDNLYTGYSDGEFGPEPNYLNGRITNLEVDPTNSVINVGITAEVLYLSSGAGVVTGDIIENQYNTIDIIEDASNTDNIIEVGI